MISTSSKIAEGEYYYYFFPLTMDENDCQWSSSISFFTLLPVQNAYVSPIF